MIKKENCLCEDCFVACACTHDCEMQQVWVDTGVIISCDICGKAGLSESDGWIGVLNEEGQCAVYCSQSCAGEDFIKWKKENDEAYAFIVDNNRE